MPVRIFYASQFETQLRRELLDQAEDEAKQLYQHVVLALTGFYDRTFAHWGDSGRNKFARPTVKFDPPRVHRSSRGIRLEVQSMVIDGSGKPHVLWHWLTFGTADYIARKPLRFEIRNDNRTTPGDLDARPFPGWSGQWVTIAPGKIRKGIKARLWYQTIAKEMQKTVAAQGGGFRYDGWEYWKGTVGK